LPALKNKKKVVDTSTYYLDPPTGFTAQKLSDKSVHLTWNAVSGASYYTVSVRTNLDSSDTRTNISSPDKTVCEHYYYSWYNSYYVRHDEVTTLYYYVKAIPKESGYIESAWSEPVYIDVP